MTVRPNLLAPLLLALFLLTPAAVAQLAGSPAPSIAGLQPVRQLEGITEYQLPNGLRVLLARAENEPARVLNKRMTAAAYDWHGYRHHTLGARSDVERIPLPRLRAFYQRHYRPDNAVLVIGGRFDATAALARVTAAFGPIA